jgi:hypothetical protein
MTAGTTTGKNDVSVIARYKPRAHIERSQGSPTRVPIISFFGHVKLRELSFYGQCLLHVMGVAVESHLDRLRHLMPVDSEGVRGILELGFCR